jgi:hypothetical protein
MRLYHVTDRASARAMFADGFEDSEVIHDNRELQIGVWPADRALAGEEDAGPRLGPLLEVALEIELPAEVLETYERQEEGKPYREFGMPAELVNRYEVAAMRDLEDINLNERRRRGRSLDTP